MMKVTQSNFREKIVWLIDYQSQGSSSLMLCSSCITVCKKAIHVHACTLVQYMEQFRTKCRDPNITKILCIYVVITFER